MLFIKPTEYGFNKVVDSNTSTIVLYSGTWTVVAMPDGYNVDNIKSIFPGYTVTETDGVITILIS